MKKAAEEAHEAANNLQEKEAQLSEITEDMARLMARYQSAERYLQEIELLTNGYKSEAVAAEASKPNSQGTKKQR